MKRASDRDSWARGRKRNGGRGRGESEADRRENKNRGKGASFAYLLHYSEGTRRNTLYLAPVRRALPFFQRRRRFSKRRGEMITFSLASFRAVRPLKRGLRRWAEEGKEREREREIRRRTR